MFYFWSAKETFLRNIESLLIYKKLFHWINEHSLPSVRSASLNTSDTQEHNRTVVEVIVTTFKNYTDYHHIQRLHWSPLIIIAQNTQLQKVSTASNPLKHIQTMKRNLWRTFKEECFIDLMNINVSKYLLRLSFLTKCKHFILIRLLPLLMDLETKFWAFKIPLEI